MVKDYTIIFRDLEFEGLKFKRSKTSGNEDFDTLLDDGSYYSEIRFKKAVEEEALDRIHISLSYSVLITMLAIVLTGLAFMLVFIRLTWPSYVLAGSTLCMILLSYLLRRKADRDYRFRGAVSNMVEMVFEEKREKAERADDKSSEGSHG